MQRKTTKIFPFLMQEKEKTEYCRPKGKDRIKLIVVHLAGNCMQTRQSKLEYIIQEREKEIPNWRKRIRG